MGPKSRWNWNDVQDEKDALSGPKKAKLDKKPRKDKFGGTPGPKKGSNSGRRGMITARDLEGMYFLFGFKNVEEFRQFVLKQAEKDMRRGK